MSRLALGSVLVAASVLLAGAQAAPPGITDITTGLDRAVLSGDAPAMKQARIDLLRLLSAAGAGSAPPIRYALAYADWRQSTHPAVARNEQDALLDEAVQQLKDLLKTQPQSAEGLALLGSVYGIQIAHSPIRGMLLGSRSNNAINSAVKLEPNNPRVLICKGIGKFNAPAMFGGSEKEAETLLRAAIEQLRVQPADKEFPAWGRFDAHAWLGQVLAKKGDKEAARAEYAKALEVAPQSEWVRFALIPALDKR